jgi:serine/threonine-protein kinase
MTAAENEDRPRELLPVSHRPITLGKYRIIAKLGTGGMAEVYLAVAHGAMNVNRLVVVKRLRDEQANDEASREMFLDEARLAARLNHPNVIQTFEAGSEGGSWYLAMEYVEGQPLSRVLQKMKQEGLAMPPKMAARIVADALNGLHYAHSLCDFDGTPLEIVHRDVSPQNMMITYGGVSKIVDFGIAKVSGSKETAHGVFKGKVAFMAPEQVLGEKVDARADIFAAGIVLWEALTGTHLLAADTPARTLYNLMNKPIPRVSEVRSDVPLELCAVVAKALERDVDNRYSSAKAMRDELEELITKNGGLTDEAVGELVTELFADRKKTVQQQVKAQLAALSLGRASNPDLSSVSRMHVKPAPAAIIDLSEGATGTDSQPSVFRVVTSATSRVVALEGPSRLNRTAFAALVLVTLLALGVSGLALHRAQAQPPPAAPVAPFVTVTAPATPATPAATATATAAPVPSIVLVAPSVASSAPTAPTPPPAPKPTWAWHPPAKTTPAPAEEPTPRPPPPTVTQPEKPSAPAPSQTARGRTFRRDL